MIGAYTLGALLGRGGTSTVRRARRASDGTQVAVKTVPLESLDDPAALLARYRRIAALDHPHILPILEVGTSDAVLYTVMPLIAGGSLRERLQRGPLGRQFALHVIDHIAGALDYLHAREIVHLDVKPANILLGDAEHAFLSDFGLVQPRATRSGRTRVRGTPAYMSPEQCLGTPTGPASDQYALAVMSFELLTGRRPFAGGTPDAMLRRQVHEAPPAASSVSPDLPREVDSVLLKGLAKNPSQRFAHVADLAQALRHASSGAPAGPPAYAAAASSTTRTLEVATLELVPAAHPSACDCACN